MYATSLSALRDEVAAHGFAVASSSSLGLDPALAATAPWAYATQLFGTRPRMVERQPIKAIAGGRSYAANHLFCPLHTDSQWFDGQPPHAQVMVCLRQAVRGGETLLVDAWALATSLARSSPALHARLFDEARQIPFVFGDVFGATLALRRGHLAFVHTPQRPGADDLAHELAAAVASAPLVRVAVPAGAVLVVDNHRMLHGREAFDDPAREFTRLLAWLPAPLGRDDALQARAELARNRLDATLRGPLAGARAAFGLARDEHSEHGEHGEHGDAGDAADSRLALVIDMLGGVPPGLLARRHDIPEPELYRLRDRAIAAARAALLPGAADDDNDVARRALAALRRR
jgi:hypothetical protein